MNDLILTYMQCLQQMISQWISCAGQLVLEYVLCTTVWWRRWWYENRKRSNQTDSNWQSDQNVKMQKMDEEEMNCVQRMKSAHIKSNRKTKNGISLRIHITNLHKNKQTNIYALIDVLRSINVWKQISNQITEKDVCSKNECMRMRVCVCAV